MRVWAYLFDVIVIAAINNVLIRPFFSLIGIESSGFISPLGIATSITFFAYFVLMTKFFQQTLGKMVFGLKVVSLGNAQLSWSAVIFRELIGRYLHTGISIFSFPVLIFLYAIVGFTPKKQGIHDFIADTSVIHERTLVTVKEPEQTQMIY
ncbi:hypothetical protein C4B60_06185 [Jeotgalibacillus proteolyticus]|uniref:RDD domain-containing protein n=2 Tax=Jeotgalibacillus proteolyticus TaxID=2082395 RepID=A0A2S5GFH0_9BACL|nr:hypothetical protein C4B60_06185 [Jeotgalibacillus proteolyticus]